VGGLRAGLTAERLVSRELAADRLHALL
jgi:hypothetical protein